MGDRGKIAAGASGIKPFNLAASIHLERDLADVDA
jgi:hypothetical protein